MALGDVICAWLLLRGAEVALSRLGGQLSATDKAFYEGKVASARWFTRTVLPKLAAEVQIAEETDLADHGPARKPPSDAGGGGSPTRRLRWRSRMAG